MLIKLINALMLIQLLGPETELSHGGDRTGKGAKRAATIYARILEIQTPCLWTSFPVSQS